MLRNFAYALLYIFLFFVMNVLLALFIEQDPAFFLGANVIYLLGAFLSFKASDVFRCVFIVLVLAFLGSYGTIDDGPILREFLTRFFINTGILIATTFSYIKLTDIFEKIENKENKNAVDEDVQYNIDFKEEEKFPILSAEEFLLRTSNGRPCKMQTTHYYGYEFLCACGKKHIFNQEIDVMRELSGMRLVFLCPDDENYATCVKIRGHLKFTGFKSLFGTSGKAEPNSEPQKQEAKEKESMEVKKESVKEVQKKESNEITKRVSAQLLIEAAQSLNQSLECNDLISTKIVILTIYKSLSESQRLGLNDMLTIDEVIKYVLNDNDDYCNELKKYFDIYIFNHDEIAATDKDDSTKLFLMARIHAMYLFRDKTNHELVSETFTIVQFYGLILKIINISRP